MFTVGHASLKAHHVESCTFFVVLAKLHHRPWITACSWIIESDRLHRTETQSLRAAVHHHFDRHAAFKEVGCLEMFRLDLFGVLNFFNKFVIFVFVQRTVEIVICAFAIAICFPGDFCIDGFSINDRSNSIKEI
ncbi:hypothetical protein D3C87_1716100 [compost metagenome]